MGSTSASRVLAAAVGASVVTAPVAAAGDILNGRIA